MCYYLKTQYYTEPLFKEVDATYIIHLEGNEKRHKNIIDQLTLYHPTKIVHIVFNKGYKKCDKPKIKNSVEDLIDTYLYILNDAKKYNTILILEDDFMFHKDVKNHTTNIDTFVKSHDTFIYRLGCIPNIQIPYNMYTYRGISGGAHCILYSKTIRNKILNDKKRITDWDIYINFFSINYIYYTPICYQLFPNTENRNNWGIDNAIDYFIAQYIIIIIISLLKLDTSVEPGYSILYFTSKLIPVMLFILAIYYLIKFNKIFRF